MRKRCKDAKNLVKTLFNKICSLIDFANSSVHSQFLTTEEYKKIAEIPQNLIEQNSKNS